MICFMAGAIQVFAALLGFFAITAGWFVLMLFAFFGVVVPFFLFMSMFANFPVLTGIIVIIATIWLIVFIIRKGFQGLKICIDEIRRYFDDKKYDKYN